MTEAEQFLAVLEAVIRDVAEEGNSTQLQTTYTPPGQTIAKILRITVVPEQVGSSGVRRKVALGDQSAFINALIDAFQEVATKRNHLGYSIIRQVVCTLQPTAAKVRFIIAPDAMDIAMNSHIDPRVGD